MPGDFNGSTSIIQVTTPTQNLTGQPVSMIGWFYFDALASTRYLFAANGATETAYTMFMAVESGGNFYCQRSATSGSITNATYVTSAASTVSTGIWVHLCVTHNGTFTGTATDNWKMYRNKTLMGAAASQNGVGSEVSLTGRWCIGGHNNLSRFFDGRAHKVRIYNRVLTQEEIDAHYAGTDPATTGLLDKCDLDTTTTDTSGTQTHSVTAVTLTNEYPQPGLQAWFRADTVTGNPISAITDRSGNGCDLAQATSGNRPALYEGGDWPTDLIQNTDYDCAAGAEKHTCLDKATGSGPVFNSQNLVAFFVAGSITSGADNDPLNAQTLLSIGDPSTGSTGIFDFSITPPGDIAIRRTKATTQTLTSSVYMTCNPRIYAVRCNATNTKLFNELRSETLTALTADTATGLRLGATPGTIDNAWNGDIAEVLIYSKDMTDAQVQAEIARLQTVYGLTTPTKTLVIEGSSSAGGYRSTDHRGFVRPMYRINSGLCIHSDATGGNTFTDFDADLANISAIANGNTLPTVVLAWLGALDLSAVADNGAAVHTELTDWIAAARAYEPLNSYLRQIIVATILPSGTDTDREAGRLTYNALVRTTSGIVLLDLASVAGLIPAGNTGPDLTAITSGPLYGDVQHLNDDGYAAIQTLTVGTVRNTVAARNPSIPVMLVALGMV